ncbi:MAG TPA: ATP-grasp domain-containing protein [Acidimicrobiales bacterium]|nr:ATP-grasp domain-containing protein [Acidimicrobiales bacterium]
MPRLVLVLPSGSYRAEDFLEAAEAAEVDVIVASEVDQAMGAAMADRALRIDLCDPVAAADAIVERARWTPVDGIVAVDDGGVLVAARAGARLGLRHNDPSAVAATRDKSLLRTRLAAAGIPQPDHRLVEDGGDVSAAAADIGFPVVVKPVGLSGSRGVIRADDPGQAAAAAARIRSILADAGEDPAGPLLVERFVAGAEVAVEALLVDGAMRTLAVFDKPDPLDGPYFEETIYVTPSRHPAAGAAAALVERAAAAIGLTQGPLHAEVRLAADGPRLLELAARSIGGLCSRCLRFGAGISLEELIVRHAARLELPSGGAEGASGVMMIPIPATGVLERVGGTEAAGCVPGVDGVVITVAPGRPVRALPEGDRYLGFVFARGPSPAAVEESLRAAHAALEVVITPPPK